MKNEMQHTKTNRKCPKCKSTFGVFLSKNIFKAKSEIICFNGNCDFTMNIVDWNARYKRSQFVDEGFETKL